MDEILEILEKDGRTSIEDIAKMIRKKPEEVKKASRSMKKKARS